MTMTTDPTATPTPAEPPESDLIAARREKLRRFRDEMGIDPYGARVDGLAPLADARATFDAEAQAEFDRAAAEGRPDDPRRRLAVAGRVVQHRDLGKLVFVWIRDHTGDLQITVSQARVAAPVFDLCKRLDYGDIVVADGPIGCTKRGEVCVWADALRLQSKSLVPPPAKWHGLTDAELRYRHRYVDMFANPETMRTFTLRSRMVSFIRRFMDGRGYLEVETPMMQAVPGGAAARPFVTHHNALDMRLFMRIAPELYLKRLLVGGMPRVYEINRNFRNEGIDRSHNPEFTAMEVYQAFGDCWTMLELTESLIHELAVHMAEARIAMGFGEGVETSSGGPTIDGAGPRLRFGELVVDYSRPFRRIEYGELFERAMGFAMTDRERVAAAGRERGIDVAKLDHWLVVNELFERHAEALIDPARPTFVTGYPSAISPLTKARGENPELADRWDIFIAGMEIGPAYSELNDPDVQLRRFTEQLAGEDDEERTFRTLDEDFIHALRVGMPPAGGLGLGIDRLAMLMTDSASIRDVILFPLLRQRETDGGLDADACAAPEKPS